MNRSTLLALLLVAMTSNPTDARAKVRVVATIPDFAAIAVEVGGDLVDVTAMVRPTQDPHYLDGKPSFVVALNRADLLLLVGMELESGWLPPLLSGARNSAIQKGADGYLDCSTLISPMEVQAPDRAKGDIHPGGNPHYWNDPRNGLLIARGIADRLARLDPDNSKQYVSNCDSFTARLKEKMADWSKRLEPLQGTRVVVYHKSWAYFLDWSGLVEAGALEPKPGIPPSPAHIAGLIKLVGDSSVRFVLQESFHPTDLSKQFARQSGAKLLVLPTMVGAGNTRSYSDVIDNIVTELTR